MKTFSRGQLIELSTGETYRIEKVHADHLTIKLIDPTTNDQKLETMIQQYAVASHFIMEEDTRSKASDWISEVLGLTE